MDIRYVVTVGVNVSGWKVVVPKSKYILLKNIF
jgi:hypothetical protein